jgi:hypothetical protein
MQQLLTPLPISSLSLIAFMASKQFISVVVLQTHWIIMDQK